jgi:hypothetical protein
VWLQISGHVIAKTSENNPSMRLPNLVMLWFQAPC